MDRKTPIIDNHYEVYLEVEPSSRYPRIETDFNPNEKYPEYPWSKNEINSNKNDIYNMIRNCFHGMGYDSDCYGKNEWNPLGDIINEGDTVLIKPNWVMHKNKNQNIHDNLECLITHPSIVRAVLDYVIIALKGTGRIILGDAPMQESNLQEMFKIAGYDKLFDFYNKMGVYIEVRDLRKYSLHKNKKTLSAPIYTIDSLGSLCIDIGESSMHSINDKLNPKYKVSDYTINNTKKYHNKGKHIYDISRAAIDADVIINLPKLKCHRLAGMTGAMKNLVGITYEKASLPHRNEGDDIHIQGDAYKVKSHLKKAMSFFDEKEMQYRIDKKCFLSQIMNISKKVCYILGATLTGDKFRIGSWYGNDTIWRTVVDLNNIMLHVDKSGHLSKNKERKILSIGDMIICGEAEGPISPSPKKLGMIMIANNTLIFDIIACKIMGFNYQFIKSISNPMAQAILGFQTLEEIEKTIISSNIEWINNKSISSFNTLNQWQFLPHSCWKNNIEL